MAEEMIIELWKEAQKKGAVLPCPRCGNLNMREEIHQNTLSRRKDIYICPHCGTEEALADISNYYDEIEDWYIVKLFGDHSVQYKTFEKPKRFVFDSIIKVIVTAQDIDDIMATALEGGINYWCNSVEVEGEYLGEYASDQISRGGALILYDDEEDKEYKLTLPMLMDGISMAIQKGYTYHGWLQPDGKLDLCNFDAIDADVVVQFAIFREIIYG